MTNEKHTPLWRGISVEDCEPHKLTAAGATPALATIKNTRVGSHTVYSFKQRGKSMNIQLNSERNISLDLDKTTSIMLVGKCGAGKTKTIKEILRQAKAEYDNLDVLYLDDHEADFNEVRRITGELLNDNANMTEEELGSLRDVVEAQQKFRSQLLRDTGAHALAELVGKQIEVVRVYGVDLMPDDIMIYLENGQQRYLLAHEYYKRRIEGTDACGFHYKHFGNYTPARLLLCFDEFYTLNMSEEGKNLVHDIASSVIRFGRIAQQSIVLTTQRIEQHKEYGNIYNLASVKVYFHSGLDNEVDYQVLFGKKLPLDARRGDVTFVTPFSTPIKDGGVVSKLWESMDEVLGEHELEDFSLSDIKMLSQILKHKVPYLNKMFERRLLHIIEVTRELDFSDCTDINMSWHCVGKEVHVSTLIHQLPNDYVISTKMLNMSDEDLVNNKDLCRYIG